MRCSISFTSPLIVISVSWQTSQEAEFCAPTHLVLCRTPLQKSPRSFEPSTPSAITPSTRRETANIARLKFQRRARAWLCVLARATALPAAAEREKQQKQTVDSKQ